MKISMLIIGIFLAIGTCTKAQDKIPKSVLKSFEKKYPEEKSPDWSIDSNGNYEAGFKKSGEKYRADFSSKTGNWIETELSIKFDDLPTIVQDKVKKDYEKDDITEIELVDHFEKGVFYDVEFKQKGKNHDIEFNAMGQKIGEEN